MKVYTIESMDRIDYDFSIYERKLGCFYNKENAFKRAKEEFEEVKKRYAKKIKQYSDKSYYPDRESGAVWIETSDDFYCVSYGKYDEYESHAVVVNDWDIED